MSQTKKVNVIVGGAAGRMGRTILSLAHRDPQIKVAGAFERPDHELIGHEAGELIGVKTLRVPIHPDLRECARKGDVLIDFTDPDAVSQHLDQALESQCKMVIGTTGLSKNFLTKLKRASKKIAIVQSPNMSVGVNLLFRLVELVGHKLDEGYDIEIVEEHHRHKKDAPSGTAVELLKILGEARKISLQRNTIYGRKGLVGSRRRGTLGVHAVRGGDTVGVHKVFFIGDGERIELTHKASSREAFGGGAILAAKFIAKQKNGLYNMHHILGL